MGCYGCKKKSETAIIPRLYCDFGSRVEKECTIYAKGKKELSIFNDAHMSHIAPSFLLSSNIKFYGLYNFRVAWR